jgi:hypothetical protein
MNLKVEAFLEEAFQFVEPTSEKIGRVVVEPDYEATVVPQDAAPLAQQLRECLSHSPAPPHSPQGVDIAIPDAYPLLKRYLRQITVHADTVEGSWIEVAPPGNWI